jgi:hypothetical protein
LTDAGQGVAPRFSDDRQWWWTGTQWVPASQAPAQTPSAPQGFTQSQAVALPSPKSASKAANNWKIKGGTLALEAGIVRIQRSRKVETIPVNTIVGTELSHIGAASKLGCLGCSTFFLVTIPIAILIAILPHPWVLTIQTQGDVKVVVPVGPKGRAVAIQRAILEAR